MKNQGVRNHPFFHFKSFLGYLVNFYYFFNEMTHQLSLEVPYITNPKVLRIFDTSVWDSEVLSSEIKLDIISPGFIYPISLTVTRGFDRLYNSSSLGIYPSSDIDDLKKLPDGIYIIRLNNINGEDCEWVEYNHLRQTAIIECWNKALCSLNINDCTFLTKDIEKKRKDLYQIKMYIDAAKAKVEFCNSPNEGLELHNYAKKLLENYNRDCNC
jgi:hypothetical protein